MLLIDYNLRFFIVSYFVDFLRNRWKVGEWLVIILYFLSVFFIWGLSIKEFVFVENGLIKE